MRKLFSLSMVLLIVAGLTLAACGCDPDSGCYASAGRPTDRCPG